MSDNPESPSPFAAFSPAAGFDMLENMWRMMQMPGLGGTPSPSSMMSDMMAPMANLEELDKRITEMRAVEQWLKLNLNLLQSAIQALEVQRATLATLKAFGAFAQSSLEQAAAGSADLRQAFGTAPESTQAAQATRNTASESTTGAAPQTGTRKDSTIQGAGGPAAASAADPMPAIDPTPWWNLLQTQFNQIAALALAAQPVASGAMQAAAAPAKTGKASPKPKSPTHVANPEAKPTAKSVQPSAATPARKRSAQASAKDTRKNPAKGVRRVTSKETAAGHADHSSSTASTQVKARGLGPRPATSADGTPSLGPDWPSRES